MRESTPRPEWVAIAALTALAAGLRIPGLGAGPWIDEIFTWLEFARAPLAEITTSFPSNNNHPLYSVLANLSLRAFGDSAWALRLPAFAFGVACVPLLWRLGRRVVGAREALLAAALLAVAYHPVWFSQNARGYTGLLAFTLLATERLLAGLEERRSGPWLGYAFAAALGAYTHLTMGFVILAHGLVAGWVWAFPGARERLPFRFLLTGFGLGGLLSLALYAPLLADASAFFGSSDAPWRRTATLGWALAELARGFGFGAGALAVLVVAAVAGAVGLWSFARERPVAFALFTLPFVLTTAGALAMGRPVFPRFYFFGAGFALLLAVRAGFAWSALAVRALRLPLAPEQLASIGALALVALGLATAPLAWGAKQDFGGAVAHARERAQAGARTAVVGIARVPVREIHGEDWPEVATLEELHALEAAAPAPLDLVYVFPQYLDAEKPALMAELRERCGDERTFAGTLRGGAVRVCRMGAGE